MPSPNTSSSISSVDQTTSLNINALLSGSKWGGVAGTGTTLTYSFPWASSSSAEFSGPNGSDYYSYLMEPAFSADGLNVTQQAAARNAVQAWANVANTVIAEVADTSSNVGDIRFAWTSANDLSTLLAWGWTTSPAPDLPRSGDIWISSTNSDTATNSWSTGSSNFLALLHELGHALGLKHSFEGTSVLPGTLENELYTVMSYTAPLNGIYPSLGYINGNYDWLSYYVNVKTPMVLDIAAIQHLYGANTSYHTGNDTYTFVASSPFFETLWDAGGTDTLSANNFSLSCVLDLTPGHYSSLRIPPSSTTGGVTPSYDGTDNLGIAYGCVIENAIGGSGNDTMIGNSSNNQLTGGAGNDTIDGDTGVDTAIFNRNRTDCTITETITGYTITSTGGGTDTLTNIERLSFADCNIALDLNGNAGNSAKILGAVFGASSVSNNKTYVGICLAYNPSLS